VLDCHRIANRSHLQACRYRKGIDVASVWLP